MRYAAQWLSLHFNALHWPWEGSGDEAESRRVQATVDRDGGSLKTYARMMICKSGAC